MSKNNTQDTPRQISPQTTAATPPGTSLPFCEYTLSDLHTFYVIDRNGHGKTFIAPEADPDTVKYWILDQPETDSPIEIYHEGQLIDQLKDLCGAHSLAVLTD